MQVWTVEWEFPEIEDYNLPKLQCKMTTPEEREKQERERLGRIERRRAKRQRQDGGY